MMRTLFLQPPSFDGFDGGAGSRYQAKREIRSFWFPTWLAQPTAMVENSRLIDAPPARMGIEPILEDVKNRDLVVMHTLTPSFTSDVRVAQMLKDVNPNLKSAWSGRKSLSSRMRAWPKARRSISWRATNLILRSRKSRKGVISRMWMASPDAIKTVSSPQIVIAP